MIKNFLLICLFIISASFKAQTKSAFPPTEFYSCWKSAHEEDDEKTKTKVFKSCKYENFRPSMFRLEIEFFEDGKCKFLHVGATDQHYYVNGKWTLTKKTKVITVVDDKNKMAYKFKIKEIKNQEMKIISLN